MIKISIIMPVYNCEAYLLQSINSVQQQSLQEWELLCIDDGSTDCSLEILNGFSDQDNRIKVYTQSNQGAGAARNYGLQVAKGEFIAFLDADDFYLDVNALMVMYNKCVKNKVDACGSYLHILRGEKITSDKTFAKLKELKEDMVYHYCDYQFDYGYYCFIYKTDILKKVGIVFPDYRRFEDPPFLVHALYTIDCFCFVKEVLYCYRVPNKALRYTTVKVRDLLKGLKDNLEYAFEHDLEILFQNTLKRIEYEYESVVCDNLSEESVAEIALLLDINTIARRGLQDESYIIKPLRRIITAAVHETKDYERKLLEWLKGQQKIILYGAGVYAKAFWNFLIQKDMQMLVKYVIVSDKKDNIDTFEGIPIIALADYDAEDTWIVVAVGGIYQKEIEENLKLHNIKKYKLLDDIFLSKCEKV